MAFWGIEVAEGKPYIHRYDNERGRLHISQAALGTFSSKEKTKRVLVQCNVGVAMPLFLCSLYPEKNETCQLNHDFEEYDEVTFSVLGPHSVHLSGYFYGGYGENQENFEDDYGSEDMTESEGEEDYSDYDTENSEDSEDTEDDFIGHDIGMFPPSPVPNSGVRIEEIIDDEKPATDENGTSQRPKKKTNKLSGFDDSQRQIVIKGGTVVPDIESEDEDEDGFPIKKKSNVSNTEEKTEVKDNIIGEGLKKKEKEDTDVSIKSVKRKIRAAVGDVDQSRETGKSFDSSVTTDDHETFDKQARKNKKKKVSKEEATNMNMDQAVAAEKENEEKLTGENFREKKKKKNKKKNKKQDSAADSHENESNMEIEKKAETKAAKPVQERTFPNGLVIEELGMGKPNGKKASPGKKVSVQYIGKLKKSGEIFDSNVGRPPFKFRLGVGEVIKGWDVGVSGMRVGDKRRLTIPPAMGYGVKGAPGAIPPNAWLVFDVELVDVN